MSMTFKEIDWVPPALILLCSVPVLAGVVRIVGLAAGGEVTPDNARFVEMPVPVIVHAISSSLFCVLGAFQFSGRWRQRRPLWHRMAGRIVVPNGILVAASGLWMTLYYPAVEFEGELLFTMRVIVSLGMLLSIGLGLAAIFRGNVLCHQAWMMRAYALGIGAGTQVFTHIPWFLFPAIQSELTRALCMGAGWLINLLIAEWLIVRARRMYLRSPAFA